MSTASEAASRTDHERWVDRNIRESCIELALRLYEKGGIPTIDHKGKHHNPATVVLVSARQLERYVRGKAR